jgi:hypothetical protein
LIAAIGVLLVVGLWTPIVAVLAALVAVSGALESGRRRDLPPAGRQAWRSPSSARAPSIDARLFGWKRVEIQQRKGWSAPPLSAARARPRVACAPPSPILTPLSTNSTPSGVAPTDAGPDFSLASFATGVGMMNTADVMALLTGYVLESRSLPTTSSHRGASSVAWAFPRPEVAAS